jgi:predicted nucleic acid-binding protein
MIFDYVNFLRHSSEIVTLDPLVATPIRDVNDIAVMQTATIGEADLLCTRDEDFFEHPAGEYLRNIGNLGCGRHLPHAPFALPKI